MKRLLIIALALVMLLGLLPAASAADLTPADFGWGSDGSNWSYWTANESGDIALTDATAAAAAGANGRIWKNILVDSTFTWSFELKVDPNARVYIAHMGMFIEAGVSADGAYWIPTAGSWMVPTDGYIKFVITRENGGDLKYTATPTGGATYTWTAAVVNETPGVEIGLWNSDNNGFAFRNMSYKNSVDHNPGEFGWNSDGSNWAYWTATDAGTFALTNATAAAAAGANGRIWKDILADQSFTWSFDLKVDPNARAYIAHKGGFIELGVAADGGIWIPGVGTWLLSRDGYVNFVVTRENGGDLTYYVTPTGGITYTYTAAVTNDIPGVEIGLWGSDNNGFAVRNMTYAAEATTPELIKRPGDFGWSGDFGTWTYWTATEDSLTFWDANAAGTDGRVWKSILADDSFDFSFSLKTDPGARTYIRILGLFLEDGNNTDVGAHWIPQIGNWTNSTDGYFAFNISRRNGGDLTVTCTPTGGETYTWTMTPADEDPNVEIGLWGSNNNGFSVKDISYVKHEHDCTYTDNGDTHTASCACGFTETAPHTYENGACICGAAEPVKTMTVYAINSSSWSQVYAYVWCSVGSYEVAWPGAAMTRTEYTVNGFDVYTYTYPASYDLLIFNNNNNGSQTGDLIGMDGKYYDIKSDTWYDSLADVPAIDPQATGVYMAGEFNGWSTLANEFKKVEATDTVATLTLELEADTAYQFKIVNNSIWTSCVETITGTVSGISFSAANNTNATLTTAAAGIYTFTYDLVNNTLSVVYPEVIPTEPTEVEVKISHTVSFDSDLQMNYRIKLEDILAAVPNYVTDGAYLTVEKDRYPVGGGEKTVETVTLYPDLTTDAERMLFNLAGIQSVEMGSELRAVLHFFDADGNEYYTTVDTYSVLAYAQLCFDYYSPETDGYLFTMLIDCMNYGAAAQMAFDRRADELVNAGLEAYQQYATTELSAELTDVRTYVDNDRSITAVTAMGFTVTFADKTEINAKLTIAEGYTKEDITSVKVLNENGEEVAVLTEFTELDDGRLQVTFTGMKSVDMRNMYYFVAYVGEEAASQNVGYSIEAYAKSNIASTDANAANLAKACIYYGDSAKIYFDSLTK